MRLKDFNVTVHISRTENVFGIQIQKTVALPEYYTKHQPDVVKTYIASQEGREFSIIAENYSKMDASIVFYVDGQMVSCLLCYKNGKSVVCAGVQPQAGLLRKFVFRKATLTGITFLQMLIIVRRCKCESIRLFRE
jgi:hypothetical protein